MAVSMVDETESYPATGNPEKMAQLRIRWKGGTGSAALAEFAVSLGLEPPRYLTYGGLPKIVEIWPPGAEEGVLEWDLHDIPEGDIDEGRN
jgi:hypothetical protein